MPAMTYQLRWPDQTESHCYSPSLVIRDFFAEGERWALPEFLERIREATAIASARVEAKYGFPCSRALGQLARIEAIAVRFSDDPDAQIEIGEFDQNV